MKSTKEKTTNNEIVENRDDDGMLYFGMFTEVDGKIIYQECEEEC